MSVNFGVAVRPRGFTLIELMIVVAIIGILAAVATAAYNEYIRTSQATIVDDHYEEAIRHVRWEYAVAHSHRVLGILGANPVPTTPAEWIAQLDTGSGKAPGGGTAYVAGAANNATGAVGIQTTGSFNDNDSVTTISRPAWGDLPAHTTVVNGDAM